MKPGSRQLLLLAGLAGLLALLIAVAIHWVARPEEASATRASRTGWALPFRPGDARALVVAPRGGSPRRLEGDAAGDLLRALSRVRVRGRLDADPARLAPWGLDPPAARVTVELRGGGTLTLDLGDASPFDRSRFGLRDGEVLVLEGVPDALLDPPADAADRPPRGGPPGPSGG